MMERSRNEVRVDAILDVCLFVCHASQSGMGSNGIIEGWEASKEEEASKPD
jgi:hypothetical protein